MNYWTPKEIKTFRKKHGLSRPALGKLLGVSGNYIYLMERGVRTPSKTLRLLLDCVERQLEEKRKESVKRYGKRNL